MKTFDPDLQLINKIRTENDQQAWITLYSKYKKDIETQVYKRLVNIFEPDRKKVMFDDLYQEGWMAFVQAIRNYDVKKENAAIFRTYANKCIEYAVKSGYMDQLNSLGLTHKPSNSHQIHTVFIDSCMEKDSDFDIPESISTEEENLYDKYIQPLIDAGEICDKGKYNGTRRAIQIIETLRLLTDDKHKLTKADLVRCLSQYRMLVHHNSVKPETENTIKSTLDELLLEVDPLIYSGDNDDQYMIKYDGYKENRLANNLEQKEKKTNGSSNDVALDITNFYYQHPFSYEELNQLINLITFSNLISEDEKLAICTKLMKTASSYYQNPFIGMNKLKFNPSAVSGRLSGKNGNVRKNVSGNLRLLQDAMNKMVQVRFYFNRYGENGDLVPISENKHILSPYRLAVYHDEFYCIGLKMDYGNIWHYRIDLMSEIEIICDVDGKPVPVELIPGGIPSAISSNGWDPQKYMAEHLYMGYDEPIDIQIRLKKTDYTILQDWFGSNYKKIKKLSGEDFDVVEVTTSPSMIIPWALQYGEKIEILNPEIREQIRSRLTGLVSKYSE